MNICFLMYPWDSIEPDTDSTLRIIHECASRGHRVALTTASGLTIRDSVALAFCSVLKSSPVPSKIGTFYRQATLQRSKLPLAGFDVLFMRADPPLDNIALNFLDSVRHDTFIINDINGLRIANNKLYTAAFGDPGLEFIPKTYVSKNREYLERVLLDSPEDRMILKPLNGYGGHGVIVIETRARQSFRSLLDFYIGQGPGSNYVILQEFVPGAADGDVRILVLNGEPIGAMRRVPCPEDSRSNVHAGGSVEKHTLTRQEKGLCRAIGRKLVADGLFFVGLDVIDGKLIEVNVLSPGGIARINKLNRTRLQRPVVDFLESEVEARERVVARKSEFRKIVEDAEAQ